MRSNHIPVEHRLARRIANLEMKLGRVPVGRGNPYWKCKNCGQSEPYIDIEGHFDGCIEPGILKEIEYYNDKRRQVRL